ncbi:hsp70 nucleotide exchange factor FES1 isoform X2 [Tripterygium wilfordii]|uniref:Hsp70 nucleotide exchange factor FES1 isoform X2 n=1 Tax=Tripterygium wilfordii TaxID=458696 RepID=A0A7J7DJU5_TRIWF|nr:hsp70 nucleotide exchange factor FES1 [Tripterygium wilfordii]KAF5746346.1 hsp70 nucleotide exchange factor FES1 isoform X2 [Tripterygium wilfordii]
MGRSFTAAGGVSRVLVIMLLLLTVGAKDPNRNSTSGGLVWSTAKDEGDLLGKTEPEDAAAELNDHEHLDGGFSSLDGMLQWAIGHSDPEKLKERAQDAQRLSPTELKKRQMEIKEILDQLKMPSDAQLMQIAIDDLNNSSLSLEDRHRALEELLILVEPIDNANDLNKLGGLLVVIGELNHPDTDTRRLSAWVLGKASQNNPAVQKQVLEHGALPTLMNMVRSSFSDEAIKALYAVSALIRNNVAGQELFCTETGDKMLQDILSNSSIDVRLRRKAVSLFGHLAECQLEKQGKADMPFLCNQFFLKSVVDVTSSNDLDLQEKALATIKALLELRTTEALIFKNYCDLEGALERMRKQLQHLMADEDHKEYATDVENLRREVELVYSKKLGEALKVPT